MSHMYELDSGVWVLDAGFCLLDFGLPAAATASANATAIANFSPITLGLKGSLLLFAEDQ